MVMLRRLDMNVGNARKQNNHTFMRRQECRYAYSKVLWRLIPDFILAVVIPKATLHLQ